jgi:Domain of unknown function (DUF4203)
MDGNSVLGTIVGGMVLLFLGWVIAFAGYRLFLILLPIYGFFVGITIGAHSVQALFGDGFLSTTTSWIVGFFVGLIFAALSYLSWWAAVAIVAGSVGYAIVAAVFSLLEADLDVIVWVVGVAVGIAFAIGAIVLNLQKVAVIVGTALIGGWILVGTLLLLVGGTTPEQIAEEGARMVLKDHPFWYLFGAIVAFFGAWFQFRVNRNRDLERYNRWTESATP